MKAIIFNSGLGSRMGNLTKNNPKCMLKLYNGESIFERQIRILSECGIKEFIVTVGPYKEQLYEVANKFKNLIFEFVENKDYKNTNYIVSMNNANKLLDDDILLLHGDLVFNKKLVKKMLENNNKSVCLYNENKQLPKKDFKGRFKNNKLLEVSINIFDSDCYTFQPMYKLTKEGITLWKNKVSEFVSKGIVTVYAENALNEITDKLHIEGMSYKDDYIDEIDDKEDFSRVCSEIKYFDYREQNILLTNDYFKSLTVLLNSDDNIFIVCSERLFSKIKSSLKDFHYQLFTDFSSNPKYEDIKKGISLFKSKNYNKIISIGGGSSIDVAKCIKTFSTLDNEYEFLESKFNYSNIKHIAIPTTAGTGSESTQIAVIYLNGKKISIDHGSLLPDYAILSPKTLESLSEYQKKSTLLDSLCQAIESYWSKGSTIESREYSKNCIDLILNNYEEYLNGNPDTYESIIIAANYSGKAINISRTTAAHSMSYILTSNYGISHGHAVALCLIPIWKLLLQKAKDNKELENILLDLSKLFNTNSILNSINIVSDLIDSLKLPHIDIRDSDIKYLVDSINLERMKNNPVIFNYDEIYNLYKKIY